MRYHSPTSRLEVQNSSAIFLKSFPTSCQFSRVLLSLGTVDVFSLEQMLLERLERRGGGRGRALTRPPGVARLGGGMGASDWADLVLVIGTTSNSGRTRRMASLSTACCWFWSTGGSGSPDALPPFSLLCASLSAKINK
jgi:hypothetical protein